MSVQFGAERIQAQVQVWPGCPEVHTLASLFRIFGISGQFGAERIQAQVQVWPGCPEVHTFASLFRIFGISGQFGAERMKALVHYCRKITKWGPKGR